MNSRIKSTLNKSLFQMLLEVSTLILAMTILGCTTAPEKPMYVIQVGWTKQQVLEDSSYRDSPKNVITISTIQGTTEIWEFGQPPYAFVYFDSRGTVSMFNCIRYCN